LLRGLVIVSLVLGVGGAGLAAPGVDQATIRLHAAPGDAAEPAQTDAVRIGAPLRGFDYESFQGRLEALWFERKTLLASGRGDDARKVLEQLRSLCAEEGVRRLEPVAGALLVEARRDVAAGRYEEALAALHVADALDPDSPRIQLLRASAHWRGERSVSSTLRALAAAARSTLARAIQELSLFPQLAFLIGLAVAGAVAVFALAMVLRHQACVRHAAEERTRRLAAGRLSPALGWAALLLPLWTWVGAAWLPLYWILICFRFMSRRERLTAAALLILVALAVPAYAIGVALFGMAADPAVRTTLLSLGGEYDPNRLARLRQLVEAHPQEPVYRFLLAGLYKSGRHFEQAFDEYRRVLEIDPTLQAVYNNIGNIFYATGQYDQAIVAYGKALAQGPESFHARFNLHLAQSESFRFKEAEASLEAARKVDAKRVARLLSRTDGRPTVHDDSLEIGTVWAAAISGRRPLQVEGGGRSTAAAGAGPLADPIGWLALATLVGCGATLWRERTRPVPRSCIRCGQAFCERCKRTRRGEGREYCTQCLHLFVLSKGLAPAAKAAKLHAIERFERRTRRVRRLGSLLVPGLGQLLRGRTVRGVLVVALWIGALLALRPEFLGGALRLTGLAARPEVLLGATGPPVSADVSLVSLLAAPLLPILWIGANFGRRRREA